MLNTLAKSPAINFLNACPGCSGPDNSAIRFPGIEGNAGQIGGQLPKAVIVFSFLESRILFQIWGGYLRYFDLEWHIKKKRSGNPKPLSVESACDGAYANEIIKTVTICSNAPLVQPCILYNFKHFKWVRNSLIPS
jgi:hypothetical protein